MNKFILPLILIMLILPVVMQAKIVLNLGVPISNASGDHADYLQNSNYKLDSKLGFMMGVSYWDVLNDNMFIVEPEIRFMQRGFNYKHNTTKSVNASVGLNCIDLALHLKFNSNQTGDYKSLTFLPYLGIAPSFVLSVSNDDAIYYKSKIIFLIGGIDILIMEKYVIGAEYNHAQISTLKSIDNFYNHSMMIKIGYSLF